MFAMLPYFFKYIPQSSVVLTEGLLFTRPKNGKIIFFLSTPESYRITMNVTLSTFLKLSYLLFVLLYKDY